LLVFIHPQCSCTHATLEQLDQLLDSSHAPVQVALVVYRSMALDRAAGHASEPGSDAQTARPSFAPAALVHRPVRIVADTGGALARRFGAATSGEIVLYSGDGRLLFQGGITAERSHVGESAGGDALRTALTTRAPQGKPFSVFGCPIFLSGNAR
jgi:hypothetical protein